MVMIRKSIPYENECGTENKDGGVQSDSKLAKYPVNKSEHRMLPQVWGCIEELAMPRVSIAL